MKNIIQDEERLILKGNVKGSILTAFALISFIVLPYMYTIGGVLALSISLSLGVLLLLLSGLKMIKDRKKLYLKLDKKTLVVYPYGSEKQRYEIPVERILYLTTKDFRKSMNTSIFTLVLRPEQTPEVLWINDDLIQKLEKYELKLDYLPVKNKDFPDFIALLEKNYGLTYKKKSG